MKEFKNGLLTGLTLQLAIGPVFLFIANLTLQKSTLDGLAGVVAVTIVDYLYITLSILGIGRLHKYYCNFINIKHPNKFYLSFFDYDIKSINYCIFYKSICC